MISGISGNGSRAATSEHKSSYENAAGYILTNLENNFQNITDKCIEMGCFYNIPDDELPIFKFNSITQADLSRVASNINTLVSSGLVLNDADKAMIREQFGLPAVIVSDIGTQAEDVNQNQVDQQQTMNKKVNVRKMSTELQAFENMVLDADSVNAHYDDIELKAKALMQDYTKLFFDDIKNQLSDNKDKNIIIRNSLMFELTGKLQELYNTGLEKGKADVLSEVEKANTTSMALSRKLATTPENNKIEKAVKKLFFDIKATVEDMMQRFTVKTLELKGGIGVVLESLTDGFKTDKNLISSVVESGYIDGRAITLNQLADNIETYIVTTKMDKSLCNECSPFDGLVGTKAEIIDLGLRMDHPVNPLCLGKDNCRCLILAYTLK
jgi:hypothetical protein